MTYDPADGQDEPQPETTPVGAEPMSDSDDAPEQPPRGDRAARSSGRAWVFDSTPSITPPQAASSPTEKSEPPTGPDGTEAPSWFARIREQRDPIPAETGVPPKKTSEDANRFSSPTTDTASVHYAPTEHITPEAPPTDDSVPDHTASPSPVRTIVMVKRPASEGFVSRVARFLGVTPDAVPTRALGTILLGGSVLILIALLANGNGFALTVLSAIVPLLLLVTLAPFRGHLASDAHLMLAVTALNGVIAGGILGWLAARIVAASWFDEGVLNFGAIGFGGHYAHAVGNADWLVWLLCGFVIPIVALPVSLIAPALAFRSGRYPDTTSNGRHHGSAAGAGFAIGTAAVFWAPLNVHGTPSFTTSDWTLMTIAVAILTPTIAVLATTMVGIGLWRILRMSQPLSAAVALSAGIGGLLLLRLGSLAIQPKQAHLWLEFVWTALIAAGLAGLYRWITRTSIEET